METVREYVTRRPGEMSFEDWQRVSSMREIRRFKVAELNRLLPMVNRTRKRETLLMKLLDVFEETDLSYQEEIEKNKEQLELENKIYYEITEILATDGGFVSSKEIQSAYLEEYVYLLRLKKNCYKRFKVRTLFENPLSFYNMLLQKFPDSASDIIESIGD